MYGEVSSTSRNVGVLKARCDAFTVGQLLGHSDVLVTMRYVIRVPSQALHPTHFHGSRFQS